MTCYDDTVDRFDEQEVLGTTLNDLDKKLSIN